MKPFRGTHVVEFASGGSASALVGSWLVELGATPHTVDDMALLRGAAAIFDELGLNDKPTVVVEDFRPGVLASYGWDGAALSASDSGLIWCAITGFGQSAGAGRADWSELTLQAAGGFMATTGEVAGRPLRVGTPIALHTAALYALIGVLSATFYFRRTGRGQYIDISAHECLVTVSDSMLAPVMASGQTYVPRFGNAHGYIAPYNLYPTADGWAVIATSSNDQWHRLLRLIGREEVIGDARYDSAANRSADPFVDTMISEWTSMRSTDEVIELLSAAGLASGAVNPLKVALDLARRRVRDPGEALVGSVTSTLMSIEDSDRPACASRLRSPWTSGDLEPATEVLSTVWNGAATASPSRPADGALAGVVVIDAGHVHAVPVAARVLAELGATVIRVERPEGDSIRAVAPFRGGMGYMFGVYNLNKRAMVLDLRSPEDQRVLADLIRRADVIMQNYTVAAATKLGLDHASVHNINPDVVHVGLTGYGVGSPIASHAAFDMVIQAMSGVMDASGEPGGPPMKSGPPIIDRLSALTSAAAALALLCDQKAPQRRFADVAMLDVAVTLCELGALTESGPGELQKRLGNELWGSAPHNIYRARDGWVALATPKPAHWTGLAGVLRDFAPAFGDPTMSDPAYRWKHRAEIDRAISAWVTDKPRSLVVDLLGNAGIPVAAVNELAELASEPNLVRRGSFTTVTDVHGERIPVLASPLRMSRTPGYVDRYAPPLGYDQEWAQLYTV